MPAGHSRENVNCEEKREKLRIAIVGGESKLLGKNGILESLDSLNESEIHRVYSNDENAFAARMTVYWEVMVSLFARGVATLVPILAPDLCVDSTNDLGSHLSSDPVVNRGLNSLSH